MIKVIHFIWFGSDVPTEYKKNIALWESQYQDYQIRIHLNEIPAVSGKHKKVWNMCHNPQTKADFLRYYLMVNEGGLYLDCDTIPGESDLNKLWHKGDSFVAHLCRSGEPMCVFDNFFLAASKPNLPFWLETLDRCYSHGGSAICSEMPLHIKESLWKSELPEEVIKVPCSWEQDAEEFKGDIYVRHYSGWERKKQVFTPPVYGVNPEAPLITAEQEQHRIDTCNSCEFLSGERCAKCGCSGRHRSRIATVHCPIGKW